ncbi:MAG: hypothetical protein CR972_02875 [Candidatus Moraniibacteriota bacterium]|nr:MAG: hypothetical protein CR972_02875 [Candidatus Moranbacteria bacterium]
MEGNSKKTLTTFGKLFFCSIAAIIVSSAFFVWAYMVHTEYKKMQEGPIYRITDNCNDQKKGFTNYYIADDKRLLPCK